jgi:hypothetical protein
VTKPNLAPPAGVTGWTVTIPMPRFPFDHRTRPGEFVGWLTTNNIATKVRGRGGSKVEQTEIHRLWRIAAATAYERHRVPQGLGRICVTLAYGQVPGRKKIRDSPNLEMTAKPIVDALQPHKIKKTRVRRKGVMVDTLVVLPGWGVVPDDNDTWVVRGMQQPWLPDVDPKVGGIVEVCITPYP